MRRAPGRPGVLLGWLVVLLCLALGVGVAWWVHPQLPRTYESRTAVLVLPTAAALQSTVSGAAGAATVDIDTEVQLARSARIAQEASERIDGRLDPTALQQATDVTVPSSSTVLEIAVRADDPQLAADAAAAIAAVYLDRRGAQAGAEVGVAEAALQAQVERLQTRLQEITAGLGGIAEDDVSGRALAESERAVVVAQLAEVGSRVVALQAGTSPGGEVITAPEVATAPTWPSLPVTLGVGLLAGALLAGLLVLVLERWRGGRAAALRRDATLRELGTLDLDRLEEADLPPGAVAPEAAALLARVDRFRGGREGPEVLLAIAPPDVVRRLALLLADAWVADRGDNVLVVPQPEAPQLRESPGVGLAEVVDSALPPAVALDRTALDVGSLLGPGQRPTGLPPAAMRARLTSVWSELRRVDRGVLVVLVPPLHGVEAQSVLRTAGRVVVVVHPGADEDVVAGVYEDLDFLGLSDRVVGTLTVRAVTRDALTRQAMDRDALVRGDR